MDEWQYEPLNQVPADALAANSRVMNALRDQVYRGINWMLRARFQFEVHGADVFNRLDHFILIANHTSHADTVCLLAALPSSHRNRCYSAAAEDYFYTNPVKEQCARVLANTFPFRRRGNVSESVSACARILERGDSLLFYPEGTRSADGVLQPFRKGIGLLTQGKPYPVVPAYLHGAHNVLAKGRWLPRAASLRLVIGSPEIFAAVPSGDDAAMEIANRLHERVADLGRQLTISHGRAS